MCVFVGRVKMVADTHTHTAQRGVCSGLEAAVRWEDVGYDGGTRKRRGLSLILCCLKQG